MNVDLSKNVFFFFGLKRGGGGDFRTPYENNKVHVELMKRKDHELTLKLVSTPSSTQSLRLDKTIYIYTVGLSD